MFILLALSSFCVFSYFTLLNPILTTVLAGWQLHIIFAGPLLAFAAGNLASYLLLKTPARALTLKWLCYVSVIAIPISLWLIRTQQLALDQEALLQLKALDYLLIENVLHSLFKSLQFRLLFLASIPFIFYGIFFNSLLKVVKPEDVNLFYAVEILSLSFGIVFTEVMLPRISLQGIVSLQLFLCFYFALKEDQRLRYPIIAMVSLLLLGINLFPNHLEPERNLNWSARDFSQKYKVTEKKRTWTSYAKVQTLHIAGPDGNWKMISIGDGTGHARLLTQKDGAPQTVKTHTDSITMALHPQKLLVLFSGGGSDIITIGRLYRNPPAITAVELNPYVMEHAMEATSSATPDFLKTSGTQMHITDNRAFLETTSEKFDTILYSWSGASYAHFSGAILHTTQYTFTHEALATALQHLNDNGSLVIFGANKLNLLFSIHKIKDQFGIVPEKSLALFAAKGSEKKSWRENWTIFALVIKKGALKKEEVQAIEKSVEDKDWVTLYSPFHSDIPELLPFSRAVRASTSTEAQHIINEAWGLYPEAHGDDKPFLYNFYGTQNPLSPSFWTSAVEELQSSPWRASRQALTILFLLVLACGILASLYQTRSSKSVGSVLINIGVGTLTGYFSTSMTLLLTYKTILYIGNPSRAACVAQLSFMTGGLVAAFYYRLQNGVKYLILASGAVLGFSSWILFSKTQNLIFHFPINYLTCFFGPLPLFFASTSLFLFSIQDVKKKNEAALPLFVFINSMAAVIAAMMTPVWVESYGVRHSFIVTTVLVFSFFALCTLGRFLHQRQ